jgi:Leucine-rich repeat (LRR) protein
MSYNFSQLTELDLSSLSLTWFPKLSGKLSSLEYLDLSNNKINGSVPNWLLETMDLSRFLNLSQNLFTSIDEISRNNYWLSGLDLSFNLLHGEASSSICNMSLLRIHNLAHVLQIYHISKFWIYKWTNFMALCRVTLQRTVSSGL